MIEERRTYCDARLDELKEQVMSIEILRELPDLCVYVTGSYGRKEASHHSDLDLFFIHRGTRQDQNQVSQARKALLDADLIRICEKMGFPEFSGYGEYLVVHYLEDIKRELGSPEDDHKNYFTARLLLLLESQPLHNSDVYDGVLQDIIETYYRDYHDHVEKFRPVFMVNDIMRFWKTLCLNYEHKRNRPAENQDIKNKNHLLNLKLKFSRLLTCFSTVIYLSHRPDDTDPTSLKEVLCWTPLERLRAVQKSSTVVSEETLTVILEKYSWFLEATGKNKLEVIAWIADRSNRAVAFDQADQFGDKMYEMLCNVAEHSGILRYLVV